MAVRSGSGRALPFQRLGQPSPPVELAVRPAHAVPGVGRRAQVTQDPLALDVLLEPVRQPRPGPGQRLVGDLDRLPVRGDQPGSHQPLHDVLPLRVGEQQPARHPGAHRVALVTGGHQAQQHLSEQLPLPGRQRFVQLLGRLRDAAADAAGRLVAGDRQGAALPALPGPAQCMREQRQRTRLALHLPNQQIHQARLEQQAGRFRRPGDRGAQPGLVHRSQQVQAALDQPGDLRVLRPAAPRWSARMRDHHRATARPRPRARRRTGSVLRGRCRA